MALEEVTTEVEVEDPRKKKKKLASMKKVEVTKTKPSTLGVGSIEDKRASIVDKAVNSAKNYALMDAGFKAADTTIKPKADFKEWSDKYRVLSADREKNRLSMLKNIERNTPSNNDNIGHKYKNLKGGEIKVVKKQTPTIEGEMFGKRYTKAQMDKDNKDQTNMLISGSSDYKNGKRISPMKDRLKTMKMYHLKD